MPHKTHVLDGRALLVDSITQLDAADAGAVVVSGRAGPAAGAAVRRVDGLSLRPPRADVLRR